MVYYNKAEETRIQLSQLAEQLNYINRQMAVFDYNSRMADAYDDGIEDGVKEVAINMLKYKVHLEKIQMYTNLSQAQIEQLAKENNLMP